MAFTRNDLVQLEAAIKSGTLSVQYGDRRVQYHSLSELRAARREMLAEIEAAERPRRPRRVIRMTQSGQGLIR